MKVRWVYLRGRGFKLNNGRYISFWKDVWLDDTPLCLCYPILYDLCLDQNCSVSEVAQKGWVVDCRVRLHGDIMEQWYCLVAILNNVNLNNEKMYPTGNGPLKKCLRLNLLMIICLGRW
jgi:hypothetical protein